MPTVEKIIEKMKTSPNSITDRELQRVLNYKGFKQSHRKGSHITFYNDETETSITIPLKKIIKECYVKDALVKIGEKDENR